MKQTIFHSIVMVLLFSMMSVVANAQLHTSSSAEYSSYGSGFRVSTGYLQSVSAPVPTMKSTRPSITVSSSTTGFAKISALPMIDANGYALSGTAASFGPRRVDTRPGSSGGHAGTGNSSGEGNQIPVGSPILPMLLLMAGYVIVRKRIAQQHND